MAATEATDTRRRALVLAPLTVRGTPPWESVVLARECGYSHVGFRLLPVIEGEALLPVVGHPERLRLIEERLADTRIEVCDIEFFRLTPTTRVSDFTPYLEAGRRLGAQNLAAACSDPERSRFLDHWLELCDLAGSFGLRPHLEFMPMTEVKTYADAIAVMTAAPHPNAAVLIDPLHFDRAGSRVEEILPAHHAYMAYMQLCDAPAERPRSLAEMQRQAASDRLPPGRGGLDLLGLLRALPRDLPLSVEVPLAGEPAAWPARQKAQFVHDATSELLARL